MEKSLFRFIWRFSSRQQMVILLITIVSYPVTYILLELPKLIVNDAIQGENFPRAFYGMEFDQVSYLVLLCFTFLGLVVLSNGIKLILNVYKGRLGERMLRRLRFELFQRVLRFRLPHFKKVSSGEIIPMITSEVEDVGGFIGEAEADLAGWAVELTGDLDGGGIEDVVIGAPGGDNEAEEGGVVYLISSEGLVF